MTRAGRQIRELRKGGLIVVLPANRRAGQPDLGANSVNRRGVQDSLEKLGFRTYVADVNAWPWNPLAKKHSLLKAIDPLRALRVLLSKRSAKAVISNFESSALIILAMRRWLLFKPLVVILDTGEDEGVRWKLRDAIAKFCIGRADAVFTYARAQGEFIRAKYEGATVAFVPQQTDTRFYTPAPDAEEDFILSVGDDGSRDYGLLKAAIFELGLSVTLRTRLVAEDRERFPNVRIVGERLSDAAFRDLYRRAKIVALPLHDTLHAGGITVLLESFACGKAIVVSNSRGVRDYLHDGENCLVVPCGDEAAFRAAVCRLLADDELRTRLAQNARQYAEAELSQDLHAQRLATAIAALSDRTA